jgi:hypothetical protein
MTIWQTRAGGIFDNLRLTGYGSLQKLLSYVKSPLERPASSLSHVVSGARQRTWDILGIDVWLHYIKTGDVEEEEDLDTVLVPTDIRWRHWMNEQEATMRQLACDLHQSEDLDSYLIGNSESS